MERLVNMQITYMELVQKMHQFGIEKTLLIAEKIGTGVFQDMKETSPLKDALSRVHDLEKQMVGLLNEMEEAFQKSVYAYWESFKPQGYVPTIVGDKSLCMDGLQELLWEDYYLNSIGRVCPVPVPVSLWELREGENEDGQTLLIVVYDNQDVVALNTMYETACFLTELQPCEQEILKLMLGKFYSNLTYLDAESFIDEWKGTVWEFISFEERVVNDAQESVSYYYTAPKELVQYLDVYPNSTENIELLKSPDMVSMELWIECPLNNVSPSSAVVMFSPTNKDGEDINWEGVYLPSSKLERLLELVENAEKQKCESVLESAVMLTVSTGHITRETANLLIEEPNTNKLGLSVYEKGNYGFFIYIPENLANLTAWCKDMPQDLLTLLSFAKKKGYSILCLDCDAEVVDSLPVYEW